MRRGVRHRSKEQANAHEMLQRVRNDQTRGNDGSPGGKNPDSS